MKKLFAAALAATMFAGPIVSAQAAPVVLSAPVQSSATQVQYRHDGRSHHRNDYKRHHAAPTVKKYKQKRWQRGHRVENWKRYQSVDYRRHHLKRPPAGYRWVRADNDFLLIAAGTGLIASIIAATR